MLEIESAIYSEEMWIEQQAGPQLFDFLQSHHILHGSLEV